MNGFPREAVLFFEPNNLRSQHSYDCSFMLFLGAAVRKRKPAHAGGVASGLDLVESCRGWRFPEKNAICHSRLLAMAAL
jgi:hypothetical protein